MSKVLIVALALCAVAYSQVLIAEMKEGENFDMWLKVQHSP